MNTIHLVLTRIASSIKRTWSTLRLTLSPFWGRGREFSVLLHPTHQYGARVPCILHKIIAEFKRGSSPSQIT